VALVAHELGHARNGDLRRGLVVGTALNGLVELYALLQPEEGGSGWFLNVFFWPLSRPVLGLLYLELHLLLSDSRRAEYLADARAAEVAGTAAAISLSEILLLGPAFDAIVSRNAQRGRGEAPVFAQLTEAAASVTPRERERRRRIARLADSRLDDTHPPTASRIAVLEARPASLARVLLTTSASLRIDDELMRYRQEITARLIDEHRDRIFR
jgi:Zn-dependent protease with chaperone function